MSSVSVVFPLYLPFSEHVSMTDKSIYLAKNLTSVNAKWIIVETGTRLFEDHADIYIHEQEKTTPNISINKAFAAADTDFVIFLANDVYVDDGWIERMLECFDEYDDCGLATLGASEYGMFREDKIIEKVYFSVCMMRKQDAWFDPNYDDLFDDSDLIMRIYKNRKKCYMNMNCIVDHLRHKTYGPPDLFSEKNIRQKQYFIDKWKEYKDQYPYTLFV